jgi:hypothetical protein
MILFRRRYFPERQYRLRLKLVLLLAVALLFFTAVLYLRVAAR